MPPAAVTALSRIRMHSPMAAPVKIWRTMAPTRPAVSVGMWRVRDLGDGQDAEATGDADQGHAAG